jgi:hypothetical protein
MSEGRKTAYNLKIKSSSWPALSVNRALEYYAGYEDLTKY